MYLTKEEERIYDGKEGWAKQTCMRILVRLGELFEAEKLIPIESAHVSGVSYKTLGDAPIEFLQALADSGANVSVKATLNPQSFDPEYLKGKIPKRACERQLRILEQFGRMGLTSALTCTPYYLEKPKRHAHLAWAESSAVVYANSVLDACTNREGGPSALAAAIIGKAPDYGMHRTESRRTNIIVNVEKPLRNEMEFGALGIYLGRTLGDEIPLIRGLGNASESSLKQFCAALAATGMTNMFCTEGKAKMEKTETINVGSRDIVRTIQNLSTASVAKPDLVFIGCPHCSLAEIHRIAELSDGKKVGSRIECWVCTSRYVKEKAGDAVKRIEKTGARVLTDMCTIVSWTETLGIRSIMTNSAKTAHYAPTLNKAETILAPVDECLDRAFRG